MMVLRSVLFLHVHTKVFAPKGGDKFMPDSFKDLGDYYLTWAAVQAIELRSILKGLKHQNLCISEILFLVSLPRLEKYIRRRIYRYVHFDKLFGDRLVHQ